MRIPIWISSCEDPHMKTIIGKIYYQDFHIRISIWHRHLGISIWKSTYDNFHMRRSIWGLSYEDLYIWGSPYENLHMRIRPPDLTNNNNKGFFFSPARKTNIMFVFWFAWVALLARTIGIIMMTNVIIITILTIPYHITSIASGISSFLSPSKVMCIAVNIVIRIVDPVVVRHHHNRE